MAAVSDHDGLNRDSSISGPLDHRVPCFYVAIMSSRSTLHLGWKEMNAGPAAGCFSCSARLHILKNQMLEFFMISSSALRGFNKIG